MMNFKNSRRFLVLGLFLNYGCYADTEVHTVDTNRGSRQFLIGGPRPAGHTYLDTMKIESITQMKLGTISMDSVSEVLMESETKVSLDPSTKNTIADSTVTRMEFDIQTGNSHLTCDTAVENDPANEVCAPFYQALNGANGPSHFEWDENGNLVEGSGLASKIEQAVAQENAKPSNFLDLSKQWSETSRVLQFISDDEVKPGDSWDSSVEMGELGQFVGTSTLLGYREIDGNDCAVFSTVGIMHIDVSSLIDTLFGDSPMKDLMKDVTMDDYNMEALVYYQYESQLVRYSKTTQTTVMKLPDPLGGGTTSIPITQELVLSSRIKE